MGADYGLLTGIAEGLKSGVQSYNEEKKNQALLQEKIDERKRQKQRDDMDAYQRGLIQNPTTGAISEDASNPNIQRKNAEIADKQFDRSAGLLDKGVVKGPDGTPMLAPEERAKRQSEADFKRAQADYYKSKSGKGPGGPKALTGEARGKVGAFATSLDTLDQLDQLYKKGSKVQAVDSSTPLIGGLISDTPVSMAVRKISDDIGRQRSGGAISADEEARFKAMLPRAQDSQAIARQKIQDIKNEFLTRSKAYGVDDPQRDFSSKPKGLIGDDGPAPGQEEDGYIFIGGDKADPKNWKKRS